jgi:hypothetical protein
MTRGLYITLSLIAAMTASLSSQAAKPVGPLGPSSTLNPAAKGGQALINGTAVDNNATPLPNATIRLRNLQSNEIEQVVTSNHLGEFTFLAKPEIPYVVEVVDRAGRILAVGDVITAQAGDVAGAVVAIPSRLPAIAGVFGETASSVISAATGTGITVIDPPPTLSPER